MAAPPPPRPTDDGVITPFWGQWVHDIIAGVPTAGTTGQILTKTSDADYDTEWADAPAGGDSFWVESWPPGIETFHDTTVHGALSADGNITAGGNLNAGGVSYLNEVQANGNVSSWEPTEDAHLTTKAYVDAAAGGGGGLTLSMQTFDATGVWTKPAGAVLVTVQVVGAGGGGGSGRKGAAGTVRGGGGGGGGGGYSEASFNGATMDPTYNVAIGAGGAGGAAVSTNDTNGNAGSSGGATNFGSALSARGGNPGGAGTTTGGSGGTGLGEGQFTGSNGGTGGAASGAGPGSNAPLGARTAGGGGAGGITAANVVQTGQVGSYLGMRTGASGYGSASDGSVDTMPVGLLFGACGGGGGGASITGNSGKGGAGAVGAGAGGGAAALNDVGNSGAGGKGGNGRVVVTAWCVT